MIESKSDPTQTNSSAQTNESAGDPLARLHKMSTTAGLGTTEYVAVNGMAIAAIVLGLCSALSLFANELLVLPLIAVVLAVVALHQIKDSNGTQTGKSLAILGIVCSLLFVGVVGGRWAVQIAGNRADEQAINTLMADLDREVRAEKYDQAYQLFGSRFTERVKPENFADTWKPIVQGTKDFPGLADLRSNGRMEFDINPQTNQPVAVGMSILKFGSNETRIAFYFSKNPDGTWKIADVPDLFKSQQGPGGAGAPGTQGAPGGPGAR